MLTQHNQALWFGSPTRWKSVETALIKSIHKGVFFDRKYWARYSKAGDAFKPIYFSSIIMDDEADKLKKCASCSGREFVEILRITSGKIPQEPKYSHRQS